MRSTAVSWSLILITLVGGCPQGQNRDDGSSSTNGGQTGGPVTLTISRVADGFTHPVDLEEPDDGTGRFFVADQAGVIRVIDPQAGLIEQPFLDVRDRMVRLNVAYDERGLLGIACHPDYVNNGRFFIAYSKPLRRGDDQRFNSRMVLSEFTVSKTDPNVADIDSERELVSIIQPQGNHNGGNVEFGPEGMLYWGVGDGGAAGDAGFGHTDEVGNAQDTRNLLGTILRYDVAMPGQANIPPDNPFVGDEAVLDPIYAFGLRNTWGISWDAGTKWRFFAADVGQNLYEEVNIIQAGGNYGWRIREGLHCFSVDSPNQSPELCPSEDLAGRPLIDPILEYPHFGSVGDSLHISAIGGHVYRGEALPELTGKYVFGDWSGSFSEPSGAVFIATEDGDGQWSYKKAVIAGTDSGELERFLLGVGRDGEGELYLLTCTITGPTGTSGEVWKIVPGS